MTVVSIHVKARIARNIFKIRDYTDLLAVRIQQRPPYEISKFIIFLRQILIRFRICINRLSDKFFGIGIVVDIHELHKCLVSSFRNDIFNKKRDRQSISIDEYRFLNVNVIRQNISETHKELSFSAVGFHNPGNLDEIHAF